MFFTFRLNLSMGEAMDSCAQPLMGSDELLEAKEAEL